ncbi:MAG TPA: DoxX family protein [Acidobacteriota bacterium]|nr:DoxX family protein [Acidobacteriota bacterium]
MVQTITSTTGVQKFAPIVTRLGMSAVFLWFGINQILFAATFTAYLPDFLYNSPYAATLVIANGVLEVVLGAFLALGIFTRIVAAILAIHLLAITIELGYGEIAVRDAGLVFATIAIALWGNDEWCLSKKTEKTK